jgi:nucleoside-diphosphate-sugar epimerase
LSERRKVLITGGTGFIGSRLALRCLADGQAVRILGQENGAAEAFNRKSVEERGAEVVLSSVTDRQKLSGIVDGIDVVYHLAAAQHEVNIPDEVFRDVNVRGTIHLLEASAGAGVKRFIHGSTIGVYGEAMDGRIDEDSPRKPDNIYGKTKLEGEIAALAFREQVPVTVIRIPETYGPGDRRLLKLFKAIQRGVFVTIGSGKNLHHLIYIDDLIDAFFLATEKPAAEGNVFLVAGKEPVSTNEMVSAVARAVGGKVPRVHLPLWFFLLAATVLENGCRPFGVKPPLHRRRMDFFRKSYAFSQQKAERLLGFRARTGFAEGVSMTADWYRSAGLL